MLNCEEIENKKKNLQLTTLTDIIFSNDPENKLEDNENPLIVIKKAEERARAEQKRNFNKNSSGTNRHYANLLHREADQLHLRGDYEAALVLYHKAASICPRDISHSVAARRTTAAISSAANPSPALRKLLPKAQNGTELSAILCPEAAAIRAKNILKHSIDPSSVIPEILEYFDHRKDFWKMSSPSSKKTTLRLSRSQIMQRQLNNHANSCLNSLISFYNTEDYNSALKIGQELISLAFGLQDSHKYLVEVNHYLALIHISKKRHDLAVNNVSQMIYYANALGNSALFTKSLVTLGKVHLTFGYLDAVCKAWEYLFPKLNDLIPKAWLLHEMGRCHLDNGRYYKALKLSIYCQEISEEANSKKWLLHGKLLSGQSLLKLERYGEAYEVLKISAKITEEEGDTSTLCYIKNLINQVSKILRQSMLNNERIFVKSKSLSIDNISIETTDSIERQILKDYKTFSLDKMLLKKTDRLKKKDDKKQVLSIENNQSITSRTYILNEEFDHDSIKSKNTDATYEIKNDQDEIFSINSLDDSDIIISSKIDNDYFTYDKINIDDNMKNFLKQITKIDKQSKDSKVLLQMNEDCELRNLLEIRESLNFKERDEEEVSLSVELLSKNHDERISMNAGVESRNRESKSPEKCFEVDTDWRLDFVKSPENEDLMDATESIQTGRTYSLVPTHALYRHSLPSSSQTENIT